MGSLQKRGFSLKWKNNVEEASQDLLRSCLSLREGLDSINEENMGTKQKEEVLYRGLVKILWDTPCVTVLWELALTRGGVHLET